MYRGFAKVLQVRHRKTGKVHAMKILKKEELVHDTQVANFTSVSKLDFDANILCDYATD